MDSHLSVIALGSNLGNRARYLQEARKEISRLPDCVILRESDILETEALEVVDQPPFLNQVLAIQIRLFPLELLDALQRIESKLGRVHRYDKGPREIDLDILLFDEMELDTARLTIPHPAIWTRPFVSELLNNIRIQIPDKKVFQ